MTMTTVGTLYLISTPIGNLGDMTRRAEQSLRESDVVLAEDTRRTRVLLDHYAIEPRSLKSFHKHNEAARTAEVRTALAAGRKVSLVADSGTPLISDPGLRLVRAAIDVGARVVPVPGPSAALAALIGSGLDAQPFTFFGFLPRSGRGRRELLEGLSELRHTAVLFESPQRLTRTLEELAGRLGPERGVVVARELTKIHEEFVRGTLQEVAAYYNEHTPLGEVVVCLAGAPEADAEAIETAARELARALADEGATSKEIVRALRERHGLERNRAYAIALELTEEDRN